MRRALETPEAGFTVSSMTPAEIIEEIGARLGAAVPPRSKVVLFGSHARGDADDGSDFDVLVIEPEVDDRIAESVRLRRELRGLGVAIDVVVMDAATVERREHLEGLGSLTAWASRRECPLSLPSVPL